jgi:hypothetical protein
MLEKVAAIDVGMGAGWDWVLWSWRERKVTLFVWVIFVF